MLSATVSRIRTSGRNYRSLVAATALAIFFGPVASLAGPIHEAERALAADATTGSVAGVVYDEAGVTLQAATAVLYAASDSSMVTGGATSADGTFQFEKVAPGDYWVRITFVGFVDYNSDVFAVEAGETVELPQVTLETDAVMLGSLNVEAERDIIEVKPDKTVLNVQGTVNSAGSDALELLKKAPGVVVDNNDNIVVSGKSGVQVYIDGKPSPLSASDLAAQLKTMQASEIDAIEIVTNPGSKYDAEGNAGIINIRMRRDRSLGFNSTLDLGWAQGRDARYNAGTTFNFRNRRVNVFGAYAFNGGEGESFIDIYRVQGDRVYDQKSSTRNSGPANNFRFGTDVFIGDNLVAGMLVSGMINDANWNNSSLTPISDRQTDETVSILEAASDNDGVRRNLNLNANLRWDNRAGITSNFDADAGFFHNGNSSFQPNYFRDPSPGGGTIANIFEATSPTNIDILAAKFDHERPLAGGVAGAGVKISNVNTDNRYGFYQIVEGVPQLDADRSNDFFFRETIGAAYANWAASKGRFDLSAGVRAEYTSSNGELTAFREAQDDDNVTRGYLDFFPSGGVTYKATDLHQFRVNYSRRIDRPNYADLNPFEFKLDELTFAKGNPFVQPQYTHSVSLTHTYKYVLNTSVSYSYTDDYFAKVSDTTDVSRTVLTTLNLSSQEVLSANVSYPYNITSWWSTYTSVTGYHTRNRATLSGDRAVDVSQTTGNVYHQSSFKLPRGWSYELSGYYNTPSIWGAVYEVDANYSMDTGVRKRFMQGRADLKLTLTDVFNTAPWHATQEFSGLYMDVSGGWDSRRLRVNLTYNLGNSQVKKARQRETSTADETSRTSG